MAYSKNIPLKPTVCESGYFLPVDISTARDAVPAKYFEMNADYENDASSIVTKMQFSPDTHNEVPLDFAFCRWLAVEKGIGMMPMSNFCLHESTTKLDKMFRVSICKDAGAFKNEELIKKFQAL